MINNTASSSNNLKGIGRFSGAGTVLSDDAQVDIPGKKNIRLELELVRLAVKITGLAISIDKIIRTHA